MNTHSRGSLTKRVLAALMATAFSVPTAVGLLAQDTTAPDGTSNTLGSTITVDGGGATVVGDVVTIDSGGVFVVSGALDDGMVRVDAPGEAVELVLAGASITNSSGPAILIANAADPEVTLQQGTTNVLSSGGTSTFDATLYGAVSYTIAGEGELTVNAVDEGISSTEHLTIEGGTIRVFSREDGLNASQDGISLITIGGGYLYVETEVGDGIDSNGGITMTGGTVIALGAVAEGNRGLDADGAVTVDGGTLIATGTRISIPVSASAQKSILASFDGTQAAGSLVVIQDAATELLNFAPAIDYQQLLYSDAAIADGVDYAVYNGGMPAGEAVDGLSTPPATDVGTLATVVTTESSKQASGAFGQ